MRVDAHQLPERGKALHERRGDLHEARAREHVNAGERAAMAREPARPRRAHIGAHSARFAGVDEQGKRAAGEVFVQLDKGRGAMLSDVAPGDGEDDDPGLRPPHLEL